MDKYHLRRIDKAIKSQDEIKEILKEAEFITLALCDGDEPYAIAMNFGYSEKDNALFFHCAKKGRKIDILKKNPKVCGTIIDDIGYQDGDCSHNYRSLTIFGKISFITENQDKYDALDVMYEHLESNPTTFKMNAKVNDKALDNIHILKFEIEHITGKKSID